MTQVGEGASTGVGTASNSECTEEGHPVDVATGKVFTSAKDIIFSGPLPVDLIRTYGSDCANRKGLFGWGWFSLLDIKIDIFADEIICQNAEGRLISFPLIKTGDSFLNLSEKLTILRNKENIHVTTSQGIRYEFFLNSDSPKGTLIAISDSNHHKIEFTYRAKHLISIKDAGGKLYRLTYDSNNRLIGIYTYLNSVQKEIRLRDYQYDHHDRLVVVYDEFSFPFYYEYDSRNRIIKETNRNKYSFFFEYSEDGRCIKTWGQDGMYYRELKYFPSQHKTEVLNSLEQETTYYWNNAGMVIMEINPLRGIRQYHYDTYRNLIGEIDENQNTTTYEYDDEGNLIARIDQENNRWETVYGKNFIEQVDPLENRITQIYRCNGNLIREEDEEGNREEYRYNHKGEWIGGRSNVKQQKYDDQNRLIYEYDELGNETRYEYDLKGRLIAETDENGNRTTYGYDAEDNLIWSRDPIGHERHFVYKGFNKNVELRDENGHSVKFEFNSEGNLTTVINENNETHYFKYDPLDRVIKDHGFDGRTRHYEYDPVGNITHIKESDGSIFNLSYDITGRLVDVQGIDKEGVTYRNSYLYDEVGRLIEARNDHSIVRFEYDALGRIIKEYQGEHLIERAYDPAGNFISRKSSWGSQVYFNYDENGRLAEVVLPGDKVIRYLRDVAGRPIERHLPGSICSKCSHDATGRLLSQDIRYQDNLLIRRWYKYNARGKLIYFADKDRGSKQYEYDKAGRLSKIVYPNGETEGFEYDPIGNLLNAGRRENAKYESGNRLVSYNNFTCQYDLRGNLVRKTNIQGTFRYRYNIFNQLVYFKNTDGARVEFRYDALGRRISKKSSNGTEVKYYWDQVQLLGEQDKEERIEYIFHPHQFVPISVLEREKAYFYHTDHLGTTLEITDEDGGIVWSGDYDSFGLCEVKNGPGITNHLRFQGQYLDEETCLHYNIFRYYDPETGRYITQDPTSYLSKDFNLYRYCLNDPINSIDPWGLGAIAVGWGIALAEPTPVGEIIMGLVTIGVGITLLFASRSSGRNWATELAKEIAQRTGRNVCDILEEMYNNECDKAKKQAIKQAQKFMGCRRSRRL